MMRFPLDFRTHPRSKALVEAPEIPKALFGLAPSDSAPEAISKSWRFGWQGSVTYPASISDSMMIRRNTEPGLVLALLSMPGQGSTVFDHRIKTYMCNFVLNGYIDVDTAGTSKYNVDNSAKDIPDPLVVKVSLASPAAAPCESALTSLGTWGAVNLWQF